MARIQNTRSRQQISPIGMIIFGVIWTAFSSIFVGLGLWITWKNISQSAWQKVPCVIERFEIKADHKKASVFQEDLKFRYDWQGESHIGTRIWPDSTGSDKYEKLSEVRERLLIDNQREKPEGLRTECRVDPKHPEKVSLLPPSGASWFGLIFAVFGGAFVLIGLSLIRYALRNRKETAISDQAAQANQSPIPMAVFFTVFALAGLGVTFGLVVPSATRYFAAKSWVETPATVIWSRVASHSGNKGGTTYSAEIFYRYQFRDREYRSDRYRLMSGSSSGYDSKKATVAAHPPKSVLTCFVNPQKPWQAIVERNPGASALFLLFPLPFLAIGFGGLFWTIKKRRETKTPVISELSPQRLMVVQDLPERVFSGAKSRWINLGVALFLCAFWNGIVSAFVGIAWSAWKNGHPENFLMIFLIPFVLIGLFFLLNIPYRLLILLLARYQLRLTPGTLRPGGTATLAWTRLGGLGSPKSLSFHLTGTESATSQNGKNSSTNKSIFHDEILAEIALNSIAANRPIIFKVPENAPPSFKATSNKIVWKLRLVTNLSGLPKITDEYDFDVRPLHRDELAQ